MISLLTPIALSFSRIPIGYSICTYYSKFGLILYLSKIQLGNKPISINRKEWIFYVKPRGAVQLTGWTYIIILKTTNISKIQNWYGNLEISQLARFLATWHYHNWLGYSRLDKYWLVDYCVKLLLRVWPCCWWWNNTVYKIIIFFL